MAGLKRDISISSSLKFGLIPRQFHCIILCVLDELVCLLLVFLFVMISAGFELWYLLFRSMILFVLYVCFGPIVVPCRGDVL